MGSQDSVQENFDDFDIDQYKADVNNEVHKRSQPAGFHLALAHGHPGHNGPTFLAAVMAVAGSSQGQTPVQSTHLKGKPCYARSEQRNKD